jgi:hypothetical protein
MGNRGIDPEEKARWAEESRAFRKMYEQRLRRHAEWVAQEERRRARLRRLSFGLLGRS